MCPKEDRDQENDRDNMCETNIQMMSSANVMSAHGMQDDGKSYSEMLKQLSAENEMRIEG